ncbi:MAG: hypothetical protein WB986_09600 [Methanoregula sp.]
MLQKSSDRERRAVRTTSLSRRQKRSFLQVIDEGTTPCGTR